MAIMARLLSVEGQLQEHINLNGSLIQQNDALRQELAELQRAAEREAIVFSNVAPLPPNVRHGAAGSEFGRSTPPPADRSSPASGRSSLPDAHAHSAPVNLQYLKNILVRYLSTTDGSEHRRMLPALVTLMRFSADEQKSILDAITEEEGGLLSKASTGLFSLLGGSKDHRKK